MSDYYIICVILLTNLQEVPVVGILRDIPEGAEEACAKVSAECGLKAIEVTMNTPAATRIIEKLKAAARPFRIQVGAGTVRNPEDLERALSAGAEFIVSPNTVKEVIQECAKKGIPSIPGALSPTEVQAAYDFGATCVKVFPVNCVGGPAYIKALRGPFRDIPLLACGGVSTENVKEFILGGADLVAFGGSIFKPSLMRENAWESIARKLSGFIESAKAAQRQKFLPRHTD